MLYFLLVDLVLGGITIIYNLYSDHKEYRSLEKEKEKCYNNTNEDKDKVSPNQSLAKE